MIVKNLLFMKFKMFIIVADCKSDLGIESLRLKILANFDEYHGGDHVRNH